MNDLMFAKYSFCQTKIDVSEQKNALIEGKPLLATSYCSERHVEELDGMVFERRTRAGLLSA